MKTIILPGYSPTNKPWALKAKNKLEIKDEVIVHEWKHWRGILKGMNVSYEVKSILKKISGRKVNIIAKSVGTRVAMVIASENFNLINKIILCGIPTKGKSKSAVEIYTLGLKNINPENVICIQNNKDPFANFAVVDQFIKFINPLIKTVKKPRSDHNYPFFEDFRIFLFK